MKISQGFDGGNIEVLSCESVDDIRLKIRADKHSAFYQWFYFRLSDARQQSCVMRIINADGAAYPNGFRDYRVCYFYDADIGNYCTQHAVPLMPSLPVNSDGRIL